jgi:O-antigen/teichoic acid export membrane protein
VQMVEFTASKNLMGIRRLFSESFADPRLRRLAVLVSFNTVGFIILNGGLRLGVFPYLSRLMGPQQFGDFLTAYSIANSISVLAGTALMTSMVRLHAGFEPQQRKVFFNMIIMASLFLGPVLAGLFLIATYGLDGLFSKVNLVLFAWPLALYLCVYFVEVMLNNVLGCQAKYITRSSFDAAAGIICLCVFPLGYCFGAAAAVYSLTVAFGIVMLAQLIYLFRSEAFTTAVDIRHFWSVAAIAPFFLGACLLDLLFQYGQRWLLAYFLDAEAVSVFFVGTTIALILMMAVGMIAQLETLMVSQRATVSDLRWEEVKLLLIVWVALSIGLPILAFLINTPLNTILYGKEMALRGVQVSYIVLPMLVFSPSLSIFRPVVIKFCSPRIIVVYSAIIGLSAVSSGIVLVWLLGLPGAAWATTLTAAVAGILFAGKFFKEIALPVWRLKITL